MTTERSFPNRLGGWARDHPRLLGASVIVAALVLTGTAVVLTATVFSNVPITGEADPTPSPSIAPSAVPSAEPSVSAAPSASAEPTPVPGAEWPPVGDPNTELIPPMWAVSVVNDLNVRSGPGTEHPAIGRMDAGDLARVLGSVDGEWMHVAADGAIGYVNAGPRSDRYLLPTKTPWETFMRTLAGVASDGEAYLAYGSQLSGDYPPYELHGLPALALRSEDGITWTPLEDGPQSSILSVAASEAGWVAVMQIPLGGTMTTYSADGITWEATGSLGEGLGGVAHGPAGWVVTGNDGSWTSSDGRTWDGPHAMPGESSAGFELEASDAAYVAFDRHTDRLVATADGVAWTDVDHGAARVSDVELRGNRIVAVLVDAEGATTVRRGSLGANGSVAWVGAATPIQSGALHVDRITQSPDGLLALGWDEELVPALWRSADGAAWERLPEGSDMPSAVGAFEPAWGPAGWVGPGLERSTDGETWRAAATTLAYDGSVPPCPPPDEVSTIVLSYLGQFAEACLGDASVTIRGVVQELGFGGCCPPAPEPAWLASPFPPAILALGDPGEGFGTFQLVLYTPPGVDDSLFHQPGTWVEVVGHYRDPASSTCRQRPLPGFPQELGSFEDWQAQCRQRFVVESVIEVDGP